MLLCLPALKSNDASAQEAQDFQRYGFPSFGTQSNEQERVTQVGGGVLCDTREQMIRFVALRDDGKEAPIAMQTVNEEVNNRAACNIAMVMFSSRKIVGEMAIHAKIVSLVEITVYAFGDGSVWKRLPVGIKQYTLMPEKGQNI